MASRRISVDIVGDESDLIRSLRRSGAAVKKFGATVDKQGPAVAARTSLRGVAGGYIGATTAVLAFGAAVRSSFGELFESQKVQAQTEAVLRSTGFTAGVTAEEVDALAQSLLKVSGVDDELIKSGENLLLTFRNIRNEAGAGNDIFNQATKATLDMSVAMGEDMQAAAIRLGKALNDPVRGLTALRRVGVQFTRAQEDQIKALVRSGHTLEAQKIILQELQAEFGGSAKAAGETLPGQLSKLRESARNLGATIAEITVPALLAFTDSANDLLTAVQALKDPRKGLPSLGSFFKNLGGKLPAGSEAIPTIGPLLGALRGAFRKGGEKAAEGFTEGFAEAVANSPRAEAAAARAAQAFSETVKKQVRKAFGTGTPFLDLGQAQAEATRQQYDDIAVALRRIVVLQGRLARATGLKEQTDLQNAVNAEKERVQAIRDQITARRTAASELAAEQAREAARRRREARQAARVAALARRDARQFRILGLGPNGEALIPGVKGLQAALARISGVVKGTFLDTGKTKSLLAHIRQVLRAGIGNVSKEVRAAIKQMLDDLDQQLKDHAASGPRTKFRIVNPGQILEGLGLTPEQERAARGRLSTLGAGGKGATGPNQSAFGFPVAQPRRRPRQGLGGIGLDSGRPTQVNLVVSGQRLATVMLPFLQKDRGRRAGSSRGVNAGAAQGIG